MRPAFPAQRQAAGAPSAWSQPSQSTHERPRRWCDAGPLGRIGVTAAQKAGVEGRVRNSNQESTTPNTPHSLGNARPTSTPLTGRLEARPHNVHKTWHGTKTKPTRTRQKPRPIGVPGTPLCRNHHPAPRRAAHNGATGLPREARCGLLFRLRGRPPALEQRGRSPSIHHPRDHAARATLGRWDALAAQRPRRPGVKESPP